jgi:hypothetical protein
MRRRLCHCHHGVVALVVLAPLPILHRCCCPCCTGAVVIIALTSLPSRCMAVVTVVAPVLLPPLSWHVYAVVLVLLPLSRWCCYPWCAGISALVMQASLPSLCLHCSVDLQASSPLLSWHVLSCKWLGGPRRRQWQHQRHMLEPSQQGTYVTYPYLGFQDHQELGHSRYIQYLITTMAHM